MAHGITSIDAGFVSGVKHVWHRLPQIKCIEDRPIDILEAIEVSDYQIEKQQLSRPDGTLVNAWALIRPDHNYTLVDSVGDRFHIVDNKTMLNVINENLLSLFPELTIQSVLTLHGGATFILNLALNEFTVKGDKSPTITNLMYSNPLGRGSIFCGAHSVRIVCGNTAKIAETEAVTNASIKRFRHTSNVHSKINNHLIDMAELKLELKRHEEKLNFLSDIDMSVEKVNSFLNMMFPEPEKDGRGKTMAVNAKSNILNIFEGVQLQTLSKPFTAYGMFQSVTDYFDNHSTSRNSDDAAVVYDSLVGQRAEKKQQFLDALMAA